MEGVLMLMKRFSKKSERLTAAQARAIPIANSFVEDELQSFYKFGLINCLHIDLNIFQPYKRELLC